MWKFCGKAQFPHSWFRSSRPELFLRKGVQKIFSKYIGEHPCQSVISIKLLCNFIEIALWHGCSLVNLLHIFRTPFPKDTSGRLLLLIIHWWLLHCVKFVQTRSYFSSVFSCLWTKYGDLHRKSLYSVRIQVNTDQKKLRIWTLFTQVLF